MDNTQLDFPEPSGIALAANNHDMVASNLSVGGAWDFASKSLPMAGIAALNSLVNIPVDLANIPYQFITGNQLDQFVKNDEVFAKMDRALGTSLESYYAEHQTGIDMAGFMIGSLVPGTLGVKGTRLALSAAAGVESTSNMGRAIGLIGRLDDLGGATLQAAKLEMAKGSPFSYLSSEALKLYGAGAVNGVVDALAFNTAATVALHRSPYLDTKSFGDLTKDLITDSILFGAPIGGLFDTFGKGVGYFGVRSQLKPYGQQLAGLTRIADDINPEALGDVAAAGSKYIDEVGKTRKGITTLTKTEREIPLGDTVAQLKARLDDIDSQVISVDGKRVLSAFETGALDAKKLLSANPLLRETELDAFVAARDASVRRLGVKFENQVRQTFDDVADTVDVGNLVKQFKDSPLEDVAGFFSGLKKATKFTADTLEESIAGKVKGYAVIDLNRSAIVSKPSAVSVFDLAAADAKVLVDKQKTNPAIFNEAGIVGGGLNNLTGSAAYKAAIENYGPRALGGTEVDKILQLQSAKTGFNFEKDFAALDVLTVQAVNKDAMVKVNGVSKTIGQLEQEITERKIDLIVAGVNRGKSPEELSAILHMPEDSVMRPQTGVRINDVAQTPKTRFILAQYDTTIRQPTAIRYNSEGALDYARRAQLAREHRDLVVASVAPELSSNLFPRLPVDRFTTAGGSGILKFADAEHGNLFQQTKALLAKAYDTHMRTKASERESAVSVLVDNLKSGGRTSLPMVEAAAFNAWQKQARQLGGGVVVFMDDTGKWNAAHRKLAEETITLAKRDKAQYDNLGQLMSQMHRDKFSEAIRTSDQIIPLRSEELTTLLQHHNSIEQEALRKANMIRRAKGDNPITPFAGDSSMFSFYDPPPNKAKEPFVLVIKGSDDHQNPLYRGQTYVHTFSDEKSLVDLRNKLPSDLQSYTKKETEEFYRGIGHYDTALAFNGSNIKNELKNKGILVDSLPGEQTVDKWLDTLQEWHVRDELAIQRNAIGLKHAEDFASLKAISYEREATRSSRFNVGGRISDVLAKAKVTEAESVINELLNVQSQGPVNAVIKTVDQWGNRFLSKMFNSVKTLKEDKPLSTKEIGELVSNYETLGLEKSYAEAIYAATGTKKGVSSAWDNSVRFTNLALATGQLRLDPLNFIVNIIGSPILGSSTIGLAVRDIRGRLAKAGDEDALRAMDEVFGANEGGFGKDTINFVKMAHKSVNRRELPLSETIFAGYAKPNETTKQFFQRIGITTNGAGAMMDQLQNDLLGLVRNQTVSDAQVSSTMRKAWDKVLAPSDLVESELQWISADAGLQIATAAKLKPDEALALVNTIVQKLQGNFTAAQKPQIFQGTIGAAVGLFQSYQARLIHRILDVVDSGDKRMLAEMAAMQAGIFGTKSLPGFDYLNTTLIAENNKDKQDIYSGVFSLGDRKIAESLMYGVGSSVLGLNLSTRGAVDFRAPSSFGSIPAVSLWTNHISQTAEFVTQAAKGADVSTAFNHSLQHNVFNRPLQQLASWTAGYRTSADGKIAIDSNDPKFQHPDAWLPHGVTQFMRVAGGAPLDEAVYMDSVYRWTKYRMADAEKTRELGQALHSNLLALEPGQTLDEETMGKFKRDYVSSGGTLEGFQRWYKNQLNNSSTDAGERLRKLIKNSGEARQLQIMLGGTVKADPNQEVNQ